MILFMTLRYIRSAHSSMAIRTRDHLLTLVLLMISQGFRLSVITTTVYASEFAGFLIGLGVRVRHARHRNVLHEVMASLVLNAAMRAFRLLLDDVFRIRPRRRAFVIAVLAVT